MKILKINPENLRDSEEAIIEAAKMMLRGGTVVFPTDTVYGLGCDATNEAAIKKIYKIKKRSEQKPLTAIVRDIAMIKKIAFLDSRLEKTIGEVVPGALTIVLEKKFNLPPILTGGKKTIALRVPDYKLTHWLSENMGRPYCGTSANISGKPATTKIGEILKYFEKAAVKPDIILDAGDLKFSEPSTILDLTQAQPKITRVGPVSKDKLLEILSAK